MEMPWVLPLALAALSAPTAFTLVTPNLPLRSAAAITSLLTATAWMGWLFNLDSSLSVAQPLACVSATAVSVWLIWLAARPLQPSPRE